jgi:hypothetical protein
MTASAKTFVHKAILQKVQPARALFPTAHRIYLRHTVILSPNLIYLFDGNVAARKVGHSEFIYKVGTPSKPVKGTGASATVRMSGVMFSWAHSRQAENRETP